MAQSIAYETCLKKEFFGGQSWNGNTSVLEGFEVQIPYNFFRLSTGGQTLNSVSVNGIEKKYGRIKGNVVRHSCVGRRSAYSWVWST
jgi:hypothetical protein